MVPCQCITTLLLPRIPLSTPLTGYRKGMGAAILHMKRPSKHALARPSEQSKLHQTLIKMYITEAKLLCVNRSRKRTLTKSTMFVDTDNLLEIHISNSIKGDRPTSTQGSRSFIFYTRGIITSETFFGICQNKAQNYISLELVTFNSSSTPTISILFEVMFHFLP